MRSLSIPPLLLIIWRRPELVRRLISAVRPLQPAQIFVACDGPRPGNPEESANISASRSLIDSQIDWPCTVKHLYSEINLGCAAGPITAIDWFFGYVDEGIILEDDCIPHPDFFSFCADLLQRYRDDQRVWCVSGNNFLAAESATEPSYYFSRYPLTWGWATWKNRWLQYDVAIAAWPSLVQSQMIRQMFDDPYEAAYWSEIFDRTYTSQASLTWWDYQWFFAALIRGAFTIIPARNLVSNIGFGPGATHTLNPDTPIHQAHPLGPMTHPEFVLRHRDADAYTYAHHFGGNRRRRLRTLQMRCARRLSMVLAWLGLR